ncbi:Layilin, partial [Ophiophagus hannah]
ARRVDFQEALETCRRDGADLISIESQSEQELVEKMIQSYSASDGDFWIGLRREEDPRNGTQCPSLYTWTDGSSSTFRRREQREENTKEKDAWSSTKTQNSPSLEIYNVIKTQGEADLAGTRPQTQNSSFRVRQGGEDLCGDYDNMAVNNSESGFVTLASTESGFVTNDIYELCHDQVGQSKESAWVENEIYGY